MTTATTNLPIVGNLNIQGPYSEWPRRRRFHVSKLRASVYAGVFASAGVFAHCVVPMIAG